MPLGLRLIQIYTIFQILLSASAIVLLKFLAQNVTWFPNVVNGSMFLTGIFTLVGSIIILLAIRVKHPALYYLTFIVFGIDILLSLQPLWTGSLDTTKIFSSISALIPPVSFIWYWARIKQYYFSKADTRQADTFMKWVAILWIVTTFGYSIVSTINIQKDKYLQKMDIIKFAKLLEGKSYKERLDYCEVSVPIQSKNTCLFTAFSMTKNKSNITLEDCNRMDEETYLFSCYAMGGYCDQLRDPVLVKSCTSLTTSLYQK